MATVAITRILYGAPDGSVEEIGIGADISDLPETTQQELVLGGSVEEIGIGADISDLPEDTQRDLVLGGSAVETGKERKYSAPVGAAGPVDEETALRDSLIAKANSGVDDEEPAKTSKPPKTPGGASAQNPQPKTE